MGFRIIKVFDDFINQAFAENINNRGRNKKILRTPHRGLEPLTFRYPWFKRCLKAERSTN